MLETKLQVPRDISGRKSVIPVQRFLGLIGLMLTGCR